jgi:hypothetical protein
MLGAALGHCAAHGPPLIRGLGRGCGACRIGDAGARALAAAARAKSRGDGESPQAMC